jgi:hypothetical protein
MSTTELVPVNDVVAEIVDDAAPLTKNQAKELDKQIRAASDRLATNVDRLLDLIEQAARGAIHAALGYSSLAAYFNDAVQIAPTDRAERKLLAAMMSDQGLSQRAIASALGVGVGTINADLAGVQNRTPAEEDDPEPEAESEPAKVTGGIDGKIYPKQPKPKPPEPKDPVEGDVQRVLAHLGDVMRIVAALQEHQHFTDEQFGRIAEAVHQLKNELGI